MPHSDFEPAIIEGASDINDRRSCRRFPAAELQAKVKIKSGIFNSEWEDVRVADYNKKGISFVTNQDFTEGQEVTFHITLVMEMGNIEVNNIKAVVQNRYSETTQPELGANHIGTAFNYQANRHMKSLDIQSQLGRIEGILERSQNLRLKLSQQ